MTRLAEVVWRDARFGLDEPMAVVEMRTVGWLVEEHPTHVVIASERATGEEYFRAFTTIPIECVTGIRDLGAA